MCLFCNEEAMKDRTIRTNTHAYVIRDGFPVTPGHTLIIPFRHIASWSEATDEERHSIMLLIDEARAELLLTHQPQGFNIGINEGVAAGQTIPHLHVHLIPRYDGDVEDPTGGVRHVIPDKANYRR
jgi:diadenosine tetraphosphate (Ap4A) HIT family hydrolase